MRMLKVLAAVVALGIAMPFALAQDKPKAEHKTESKKDAVKDKADRGDDVAENLLKRAYTRVYSAEADGLKKLHATSNIDVDASALGFGKMPFKGETWWTSGGHAIWKSTQKEDGASTNPLGNLSDTAKALFEPYLGYVTGFEAWDVRFKKASFKFGDPVMDAKDKKKEIAKTVVVTYTGGDRKPETFTVAENQVKAMTAETMMQKQTAKLTFNYTYEDLGKQLRIKSVTAETELDMAGLPGEQPDPKKPAPKADTKQKLTGEVKVTKYGKAGKFTIALEMEATLKFNMMGQEMSFPATLKISKAKINDDVKDDDIPKEAKGTKSDDDQF